MARNLGDKENENMTLKEKVKQLEQLSPSVLTAGIFVSRYLNTFTLFNYLKCKRAAKEHFISSRRHENCIFRDSPKYSFVIIQSVSRSSSCA